MSETERTRFRHEARTLLNHAVGFGELLASETGPDDPAASALKEIGALAASLRQPVLEYVASILDDEEPDETLRLQVFARIYDLISLVQTARRSLPKGAPRLADVHKVLDAVNALAEAIQSPEAFKSDAAGASASPRIPPMRAERPRRAGRILVVDDDAFNREILSRHLERQGHVVCQAATGNEAFGILAEAPFDIVILDIMMPGMNGFQFLEAVRDEDRLHDISTIVVSALDDPESMARCIELGAEDYLSRDFDPVILKARIDSLLEKKEYKRQNDIAMKRLYETQERLAAELREAAAYVRSLLPKRLKWRGVAADWEFIPSLSLGGDCFYYQRLDDDRLALYLLDVSGHGIQAALLSATIMNILRGLALAEVDFGSPASVLARLNRSFRIEDQGNMFFTIWYGVYDASKRTLRYAGAGCPPAVLIDGSGKARELSGDGPVIGIDETAVFGEFEAPVAPGSNLYLFSDGLFEIRMKNEALLEWDAFIGLLEGHHDECARSPACFSPIRRIVDSIRSIALRPIFDDDVSIVEFAFHA